MNKIIDVSGFFRVRMYDSIGELIGDTGTRKNTMTLSGQEFFLKNGIAGNSELQRICVGVQSNYTSSAASSNVLTMTTLASDACVTGSNSNSNTRGFANFTTIGTQTYGTNTVSGTNTFGAYYGYEIDYSVQLTHSANVIFGIGAGEYAGTHSTSPLLNYGVFTASPYDAGGTSAYFVINWLHRMYYSTY